MSDEQLARLLSKQEELGMGSHRLLLVDDAVNNQIPGLKSEGRVSFTILETFFQPSSSC